MPDFAADDTRKEWPGWTWETFSTHLEGRLPAVWYQPPWSVIPRTEMIRTAWESPLSYEGLMVETIFSIHELVDGDGIRAAQRLGQNLGNKVEPAGSFSVQGVAVPQLIIPNTYLVSIEAESGSQPVVNVVGVRAANSGLAQEVAQATVDAWKVASGPLSVKPSQYVMQRVRAMDLSSPNGDIAVVTDTTAGGVTATSLATNGACALIKWNGGTRSRSSRGRLYHGPLSEGSVNSDGRTLSSSTIANFTACYNNFRSSLSAAGFTLCVISRKLATTYDVTSASCEQVIATQRRRIRG